MTKADCIMSGTHPSEVLPMHLKTGAFFLCIADPDHPDSVVIDRHAHDIAAGEVYGQRDRGLGAIGRYNALAGVSSHSFCGRESALTCEDADG
ncbi:hypothetical protein CAC01_30485 (plasmid) [Streptomyces sp. CLI2509]|nr:hypothetical protein CAC01_30485 [Streptomyces sp. CLI2509]